MYDSYSLIFDRAVVGDEGMMVLQWVGRRRQAEEWSRLDGCTSEMLR